MKDHMKWLFGGILTACGFFALKEYLSGVPDFSGANLMIFLFSLILPFFLFLILSLSRRPLPTEGAFQKAKEGRKNPPAEEPQAAQPQVFPQITFEDVAGLDEVKEELWEIIDFLKDPQRYEKMGAKLPRGVLFYGPPGTGKTLLAKAAAQEASASFHFASGSEFVEKYVGVGAKRVRNLFEKARREGPSIIFIDEIDAIGARRTNESNNEKDQTLNQLLVEMDGFQPNETVIVMAATNRLDLLDEALIRPGRFDRQIYMGNPDLKVREEILSVHFRNKPVDGSVALKSIARRTPGMSGAHLASIANEAAILAVRFHKRSIGEKEIDMAIEKVLAGPEHKRCVISPQEREKIAFHEAGHALVSKFFGHESVPKVSIISRGRALGYTMQVPREDRYLITATELKDKIQVLFGGRAAESLIYNELSSGAKDDLKKANQLAREMVCQLGMSSLGNIVYEAGDLKENAAVENEIRRIIDDCYEGALGILKNNFQTLSDIARRLMEQETLLEEELDQIIGKRKISPPSPA